MEYKLSRSNRKTIGITIRDGAVFVKAPYGTSVDVIRRFTLEKSDWINAKLAEMQNKNDKFLEFSSYRKFLYLGESYTPRFCKTPNFVFADGELLIPLKYSCESVASNKKLLNALIAYYITLAEARLSSLSRSLSDVFSLPFKSFSLTNAKTKWGSCDALNNIKLNWRLIFFDPKIAQYVAAHELCHTKEHNHSAAFWSLVQQAQPSYKTCRKALKELSPTTYFFR